MLRWFLLIAAMAVTTYLVRMIPFVLCRKKIQSQFLKSLIHYLPYAILSAMTIPGIFYATGDYVTAAFGFAAALILSLCECSLLCISLSASGVSLIVWILIKFVI